jgi:hypothetical protein
MPAPKVTPINHHSPSLSEVRISYGGFLDTRECQRGNDVHVNSVYFFVVSFRLLQTSWGLPSNGEEKERYLLAQLPGPTAAFAGYTER